MFQSFFWWFVYNSKMAYLYLSMINLRSERDGIIDFQCKFDALVFLTSKLLDSL